MDKVQIRCTIEKHIFIFLYKIKCIIFSIINNMLYAIEDHIILNDFKNAQLPKFMFFDENATVNHGIFACPRTLIYRIFKEVIL